MSELLWSLLGSGPLDPSDPAVEFGFARPFPAWVWALSLVVATVVVWRAYARLEGSRGIRSALAVVRGLLLLLLLFLISGPQLIKPNEIEEPDWVLMLLDRSSSMRIADGEAVVGADGQASSSRLTRDAQMQAALETATPAIARLKEERKVVWFGFDGSAYELDVPPSSSATPSAEPRPDEPVVPRLPPPDGVRTDIERALDHALRRAAARPISGIVLLSDGRSTSEPSRSMLRRLESEGVPVFTLPLGDPKGIADAGIRRIEAPRLAFAADAVPIDVELERVLAGADARPDGGPVFVELVDAVSGEVFDTRPVEWSDPSVRSAATDSEPEPGNPSVSGSSSDNPVRAQTATVRLTARTNRAGNARWAVRIKPDPARQDLIVSNDTIDVGIELVERPLRVLYLDGYPRWEYRYLKNLLVREPSVLAATLLLSPRHRYIQEGSITLDALPSSPEEWGAFDVFVLGDLWPGVLTSEQLYQLRERVAIGGAGLVWIAGESHTPGSWRSTPLADLLPFALSADAQAEDGLGGFNGPVLIGPTPDADRLGVLRLSDAPIEGVREGGANPARAFWPPILSDPTAGWNALQWAQRIDRRRLKPTAEVLAVATPISVPDPSDARGSESDGSPLLISMRYGAGRVMYLATDEIWRWRYARGEPYTERFYIQILRLLGREALSRSGKPAILDVSPARVDVQTPVRVRLTLLEQSLVDAEPRSIRARVFPVGAENEAVELTLTPEAGSDGPGRGPTSAGGSLETVGAVRSFSAVHVPLQAGEHRVEIIDPLLTSRTSELSTRLEVIRSDDELRRPAANHELLERLAEASGGKRLTTAELPTLDRLLPNRRIQIAGEPQTRTLWDTPLALLLVVGLCTLEWIGRRLIRLA